MALQLHAGEGKLQGEKSKAWGKTLCPLQMSLPEDFVY